MHLLVAVSKLQLLAAVQEPLGWLRHGLTPH
jgi:hypothetical protein